MIKSEIKSETIYLYNVYRIGTCIIRYKIKEFPKSKNLFYKVKSTNTDNLYVLKAIKFKSYKGTLET